MPIFMDRHDLSEEVTAENVARIHQEDLKIQALYGCRGLTYWFDDRRKTAFCLIEAPDREAIRLMHNEAHGDVPNHIIEVDPDIVESFLGRIQDPENTNDAELNIIEEPAFRTIMLISARRRSLSRSPNEYPLETIKGALWKLREVIRTGNGSIAGSGEMHLLVSFTSVTSAVNAAFTVHKVLNEQPVSKVAELKIALAGGVPVTEKKLIFEKPVKLAERICAVVKGNITLTAEIAGLYDRENTDSLRENKNLFILTESDEEFLTALMDYTDLYWSDGELKVDHFSRPLACSKSQVYRRMMSLTGMSPNAFLNEYRLQKALQLLQKKAGNVSGIAFSTGFSSPSYFSKCFYQRFGAQPSDFLKKLAGSSATNTALT